jgi:hypothetical protein
MVFVTPDGRLPHAAVDGTRQGRFDIRLCAISNGAGCVRDLGPLRKDTASRHHRRSHVRLESTISMARSLWRNPLNQIADRIHGHHTRQFTIDRCEVR